MVDFSKYFSANSFQQLFISANLISARICSAKYNLATYISANIISAKKKFKHIY
jgi:hypothetical protein